MRCAWCGAPNPGQRCRYCRFVLPARAEPALDSLPPMLATLAEIEDAMWADAALVGPEVHHSPGETA